MAQRRPRPLSASRLISAATATVLSVALLLGACAENDDQTEARPSPTPTAPSSPRGPLKPSPSTTPKAPAPSRKPTEAKLALVTSTGSGGVALTFDDGPSPAWTPRVLNELRAAHVKATFCVIGKLAAAHPELIARIVREGHTLCNHSWNHEFKLGTRSDAAIRANLQRTNNAIHAAVPGAPIPYFRHPGGMWTTAAVRVAGQLGMRSLHWAVDPRDWSRPGAPSIIKSVTRRTRAGSVVLMHDGGGDRSQTLAALPEIISTLQRKHRLVSMPEPEPTPIWRIAEPSHMLSEPPAGRLGATATRANMQ